MGKIKDITGQKFGKLTVIENVGKLDGRRYSWRCICDCGNEKIVLGASLRSGNTKSCGCLNPIIQHNLQASQQALIPMGAKFGKLTVIEDLGLRQTGSYRRRWYKCECDCGQIKEVMGNTLKQGGAISCGHCLSSKGEYLIQKILDQNNIVYSHDIIFPELLAETDRKLRFDFVIYNSDGSINRFVEFDGRQHINGPDTNYWGHSTDTLETIQEKDLIKNQFCLNHNYTLIRIPYYKIDNLTIQDIMENEFKIKEGDYCDD